MYAYRNRNTNDQVERADRSARLDHLPNWELIAEPEVPAVPGPADPAKSGKLPTKSASKADWLAYAVSQSMDADEAEKLTRDELAEKYADGGGS